MVENASANGSRAAVMPYFPYSRQSKKKSHRGAITARMVANLLHIAGVTHVITIDLHASQMQGFFKCPVDNLIAEPLLSRWIRVNVPDWKDAVVVSKNPGGTKRVTSLADALKLSFGIVTTDRRRATTAWNESAMFEQLRLDGSYETQQVMEAMLDTDANVTPITNMTFKQRSEPDKAPSRARAPSNPLQRRTNGASETLSSPLSKSMRASSIIEPEGPLEPIRESEKARAEQGVQNSGDEESADEYTDEVGVAIHCLRTRLIMTACTRRDSRSPCAGSYRRRRPSVARHVRRLTFHIPKSRTVRSGQ
jgi:ribose-phosphate pyrophosphokinase